jgi:oligopeptide/dipeptide ABC transporter ATP-binding protein
MASIPRLRTRKEKLATIEGAPPNLVAEVTSCPFEVRCQYHIDRCKEENPPLVELSSNHWCACWVARERELVHV